MLIKTEKFDVLYDISFEHPQPKILATGEIVAGFISRISPRYKILSSNVKVFPSNVLSDIKVQIDMFNGNGSLEITADQFSAKFRNAIGPNDVEIIGDCIGLAIDAITEAMPSVTFGSDNIVLQLTATKIEERDLSDSATPEANLAELGFTKDEKVTIGHKIDVSSEKDGWRFAFDLGPSWGNGDKLFISCHALFSQSCNIKTIDEKSDHITDLLNRMLKSVNIQFESNED